MKEIFVSFERALRRLDDILEKEKTEETLGRVYESLPVSGNSPKT